MAETIKGINVVIGAETSGLSAALSDVNKRSRDIQSELREVDKLLKFDPGNTELLAQKQKLLGDAVANTSEKLDRLRSAQQQVADQFARGEISEGQYRAFQRELAKTEQELKSFETRLKSVAPELKSLGDKAKEAGDRLKDSGEKLSGIGANLTVGLTAPLVGMGAAIGKAAADVDAAAGKMEASLGVTAEQAEELADAARDIWKKGFGESLEEVNQALITTRTNIQGLNNEQLSKLTQQALILSETFGADVNETTRTASVLMKNFGIDGAKAMDLMTIGFQKGGDFSGELLDTLREYAPQFKALGISAENALGMLLEGTERGAFNLDKVGDALKEFNIRLKDGSDSTYEAMSMLFAPDNIEEFTQALINGSTTSSEYMELLQHVSSDTAKTLVAGLKEGGKAAEDSYMALLSIMGESGEIFDGLAKGSLSGQDALVAVIQKIREIEDPLYQNQIAVSLFGTQWEDLEKDVVLALDAGIGKLGDIEGATDKAGEAITDNFGTRFQAILREMQSSLVPLGKVLLDLAERIMPIIQAAISKVSGALSNMSPTTQTLVIGLGAVAAAAGPMLVIIGQIASAISGLMPVIAALSGPVGWIAAGIAALVAAGVALYTNWESIMQMSAPLKTAILVLAAPLTAVVGAIKGIQYAFSDAIPEAARFTDEVSASTQEAVGAFLDLNDQATLALNDLSWSGQTVTQEMSDQIVSTFNQMGDQVLTAMQEDHAAQLQSMQTFFGQTAALTEDEEADIIEKMKQGQQQRAKEIQDGQNRIAEILNAAKDQKRGITEAEAAEINKIQEDMVNTGIEVMSENELEQKAILERMRSNASALSARQAAEVVKNSLKQRDETIAAAEKQYNDVLKEIIRQRDEAGTITAEQADKLIAEAQRQRDETVKRAEEMHTKVVDEAKQQAGDHVKAVDWETGEILKRWEVWYNGLKEIQDKIDNFFRNAWQNLWGYITKKAEDIKTSVVDIWNEIISFLASIDLMEIGRNIMQGLINGVSSMFSDLKQKVKDVGGVITGGLKNVLDIHSPSRVTTEIGEYTGEGLVIGMSKKIAAVAKQARALSAAAIPNVNGSAMAQAGGVSASAGATEINMQGLFAGATIHVRSEEDIRALAREIWSLGQQAQRGGGGAR